MQPPIDIVLLGATGYTGRLCARYMAQTIPPKAEAKAEAGLTWALAGRSRAKLRALHEELGLDEASCLIYDLDLSSQDAVNQLARRARVVINVIGPYSTTCGSAVVKACAENGTDYVDCNGEMPWVQDMITQYDEAALASGAKIIFTAGWGATPADLSTLLAVQHLRAAHALPTREVLVSLDSVRGSFSGGSINSLCALKATYSAARLAAASAPFALAPTARPPSSVATSGILLPNPGPLSVTYLPGFGALAPSTQALIETAVVGRSWGLYAGVAHAGQRPDSYGQRFFFSSAMRFPNRVLAWAVHLGFLLLNAALAALPPLRALVGRYLFPSGSGQTDAQRQGNYFRYRTVGIADAPEGGRAPAPRVEVRFEYEGDAYYFTGVALTQAALVLLEGGTPAHERGGGIMTPALLGNKFVQRLKSPEAGVKITVEEVDA